MNIRPKLIIFLLCISLVIVFTSFVKRKIIEDDIDPNFHVYLLIGQSNMAGRGLIDKTKSRVDNRIEMLDENNNWIPAKDPIHFDRPSIVGVGPGLSFAKSILKNNHKIRIGLVPAALGGSPISAWTDGLAYTGVFPYEDAIKRTRLAMRRGVIKGIIWHQGESDCNDKAAMTYLTKLVELVKKLRIDIGDPNLPFVAGEIGYFFKDNNLINKELSTLSISVTNAAVVSARGLQHKGDSTHFDTKSAVILGKRYAIAMNGLQTQR
ncbi:MAG TPA: sialate O-acetylesterase [Daejeonella sp.]|uniref:sialate O-acetylesterase n=1 Tax=Daejeonella sp. TaxID=2805397 RepID=UPI002EDAB797